MDGLGGGSGILLVVMAVFVVLGLHLRTLIDAMSEQPAGAVYLATPVTFWVVKFYDSGIVAPVALCVGLGLLRRSLWSCKLAYGNLGGYVLLAWRHLPARDQFSRTSCTGPSSARRGSRDDGCRCRGDLKRMGATRRRKVGSFADLER